MADQERPLVTFFVMAYNQEQYIREALEGAFSQTYSPLEIILSDDCSSDRTFEIMQEEAARYRGPHQIILNRNPKNLGIGAHVNRIMELAKGELIVAAAGDDISLPERTEEIYKAWRNSEKNFLTIHSSAYLINEDGNEFNITSAGYWGQSDSHDILSYINNNRCVLGASQAWDKSIFVIFGPMRSDIIEEDKIIPFRCLLLNKEIFFIEKQLLKHRVGCGVSHKFSAKNAKNSADKKKLNLKGIKRTMVIFNQLLDDCKKVNFDNKEIIVSILQAKINEFQYMIDFSEKRNKFQISIQAFFNGIKIKRIFKEFGKIFISPIYHR